MCQQVRLRKNTCPVAVKEDTCLIETCFLFVFEFTSIGNLWPFGPRAWVWAQCGPLYLKVYQKLSVLWIFLISQVLSSYQIFHAMCILVTGMNSFLNLLSTSRLCGCAIQNLQKNEKWATALFFSWWNSRLGNDGAMLPNHFIAI